MTPRPIADLMQAHVDVDRAGVLTTDMFASAFPPPAVIRDFWTGVYSSLP